MTIKIIIAAGSLAVGVLVSGCSSNAVSKECTDYIEKTREMTAAMPGMNHMTDDNLAQIEENWGKLSKEQQQQATESCKQGLVQLEAMEKSMK